MAEMNIDITNVIERAIEKIRQEGYTVQKWIPCSERLPEQNTMVIVCCYGSDVIIPDYSRGESIEEAIQRIGAIPDVTIGFCDEEGWIGADMFPMMVQPTFWMSLPSAPEPSEEE